MFIDEGASQPSAAGYFNFMLGGDSQAVTVGGGGSGSQGLFDIEDGKVVRCGLLFGREWLTCDDTGLPGLSAGAEPSGCIYATVSHRDGQPLALSVAQGGQVPDNTLDATHKPLYRAAGRAWTDLRQAPVVLAMD